MADLPDRDREEERKRVNPYDAAILGQTLRMQHLRENPEEAMFDPAELELRQARNAYQQRMGGLMSLSGDPRTHEFGGGVLKTALEEAKKVRTEHGEYDPISGQHRYFPAYLRQREMERGDKQMDMLERLRGAEQGRIDRQEDQQAFQQQFAGPLKDAQAQLAAERARALREKTERGEPLKGKPYEDVKAIGTGWAEFEAVKDEFKKFKPPAGQVSALGEFEDRLTREFPGLVPQSWVDSRNAMGMLKRLQEFKARHAIFGAALVGREKTDWQSTEPPRGQGKKAWNEWFDKQEKLMQSATERILSGAASGGYNRQQIYDLSGGRGEPPPAMGLSQGIQATPQFAPQPPMVGGGPRYNPVTGEIE